MFDFTGPGGWSGFTGLAGDSELITLPSSGVYTLTARPDGLTDIDEVVIRDGKNLKGRIIGFGLGTPLGKRTFEKGLTSTVLAIEARTATPQAA